MIHNIGKFKCTQNNTIKSIHNLTIDAHYPPLRVTLIKYSSAHALKHQGEKKSRENLHTPHIRMFDIIEDFHS